MPDRSPARRLAAALFLAATLLPLAAAPAGAMTPSLVTTTQPEYAGAVLRGEVEGLFLLDERPDGIRVAVQLSGLPSTVVRIVAATARCGQVGGSSVRLGIIRPIAGRFAAIWVTTQADAVDPIGSLRLVGRSGLIACANTIHGQEDADVCETVPDACYGEMVLPERMDGKVLRGILARVTQREGEPPRIVIHRVSPETGWVILGDAPCSAGGGEPLATVELPKGVGGTARTLRGLVLGEVGSFWLVGSGTHCVDAELQALVWAPVP